MTDGSADDLPLAAEFPAATREQWRKLVEAVLKGASFDKSLVAKTYDGLAIEPLYGRDARAQPVVGRAPGKPWIVTQRVDHPDPAAANAEALHELENGATGLSLVFAGAVGGYGFGLATKADAIARALEGVHLDAGIALDLDLGPSSEETGRALAALVQRRGIAADATDIRFGFDPIGGAATGAESARPWSTLAAVLNAAISDLAADGFRGPFARADGRVIHNAGGSEAQELCYVLAVALAYLRALEAGGIALDAARGMIYFRLAADADQFLTMAKFRALRKLWARVEEACGLGTGAVLRRGRDRLANDDQARSLREHAAHDHRGGCRRPRRRRRHHRAAVHDGARPARAFRAPNGTQHPARAAGRIATSPRWPIPPPARAASRI